MSRLNTTKTLSTDARDVLVCCCTEGNILRLPDRQLDRKLYQEVADALLLAGIKWNKGKEHHECPGDARTALDDLLGLEHLPPKNPYDFFATPDCLADRIVELSGFSATTRNPDGDYPCVLEPSAGTGKLVEALVRRRPTNNWWLRMVEIDSQHIDTLAGMNQGSVEHADFLVWAKTTLERFDYIVMNPPFTSATDPQAWAAHVEAALGLLFPGGRLVTVAPVGAITGATKRHKAFWEVGQQYAGKWEFCPAGAFKESGAGVNAVLITFNRPL